MLKNRNVYFTATFLIGFVSLLMPNQALAQYDNTFNQNNYPPIGATYSSGSRAKKTRQSKFNRTNHISATNSSVRYKTLSAKARQELLRRWLEARLRQTRNTR
jgi:acyl-homoserine lactone acylase PvdQ